MHVRKGFTLFEVVAVIATVGVLAAVLIPAFAQTKGQSAQAGCISSLQKISKGLSLYLQDWDNTFPLQSFHAKHPEKDILWTKVMQPYVKGGRQTLRHGCLGALKYDFCYGCNYLQLGHLTDIDPTQHMHKLSEVERPVHTVFCMDSMSGG
jgi:prepilin-type N-terminal cleavage/methylation domain-containing protein